MSQDTDALQNEAISVGLAHVASIEQQPLHGLETNFPDSVSPAEGYVAGRAYAAATGHSALGVGIVAALEAASIVRAALRSPGQDADAPERRDEWRSMETVPKNGDDVLLRYDGRVPVVAAWFRGGWCPFDLQGQPLSGDPNGWMPLPDSLHTTTARAPEKRSKAAEDVLTERQRQIDAEGWTPEHDDQHAEGAMALAASCYAVEAMQWTWHSAPTREDEGWEKPPKPKRWPWDISWWRPSLDYRRNLVKAGALILAEIERRDRAALRTTTAPSEGGEP